MAANDWTSYIVSTKADWSDGWVQQPYLICEQLTRNVMPAIDSARLKWHAGTILQNDDLTYSNYEPLDLVDKYVLIEIPSLAIRWIGYVVQRVDARAATDDLGATIKITDQQFEAVGLEWFLSRVQLDHTIYYKSSTAKARVERALGFNLGLGGDGRSLSEQDRGNRDARKINDVPAFTRSTEWQREWNAAEIVEHLLYFHGPRDTDDAFTPLQFRLAASASNFLEWYKPSVRCEGRTLLQVLNEVIDRRRGLIWWTSLGENDTFVQVNVSSSLSADVVLPSDETIPRALTREAYDFDSDVRVINASIVRDGSQRYDRVRVRAAQRRTVMTISVADHNLQESWNSGEEAQYNLAEGSSPDKNDRFRLAKRFERVYTTFIIPPQWDGKVGNGTGEPTTEWACPELVQGSISVVGGEQFAVTGLRLIRTMPLKAGFDYSDATEPVANAPDNGGPEYLEPFCLAKHGNKYVFTDRTAGHRDEDEQDQERLKYSYTMRPLTAGAGFELVPAGGLPHVAAKNHFDPETAGASNFTPELDYGEMIFTVCAEWDAFCEGAWPAAVPEVTERPLQELIIYVSDRYRLDWLATGTIFDIDSAGQPRRCTAGGPLRDDRGVCADLARLAYEWYKEPRAALSITYQAIVEPHELGTLITTIGTAASDTEETLNSVVTQITYAPEEGTTSLATSFLEIQFEGLV